MNALLGSMSSFWLNDGKIHATSLMFASRDDIKNCFCEFRQLRAFETQLVLRIRDHKKMKSNAIFCSVHDRCGRLGPYDTRTCKYDGSFTSLSCTSSGRYSISSDKLSGIASSNANFRCDAESVATHEISVQFCWLSSSPSLSISRMCRLVTSRYNSKSYDNLHARTLGLKQIFSCSLDFFIPPY